ncbi:unannotated protein [freshwater metagenome]|uniref:Unannotated protein n=1 Tax=freshwater metagenome TaxID=449393 RepID=A0A6J6X3U3_9ZZZZ
MSVWAAELFVVHQHAGEVGHHRWPAHERVGRAGHDDVIGNAQQQRWTGHCGAVDDHDCWHHATAIGERSCGESPAVQSAKPFGEVGARRPHHGHQWVALGPSGDRSSGDHRRCLRGQRTFTNAGVNVEPDNGAAAERSYISTRCARNVRAKRDSGVVFVQRHWFQTRRFVDPWSPLDGRLSIGKGESQLTVFAEWERIATNVHAALQRSACSEDLTS